ncbi:unnamed protein product, partial [Vitis vinifera]|uniref:G-type lectin S-receptor-like serine/threonine-protein kinase n=1 Tax=Vitis vinifera TaxID=29760 RepID=E0CSX9_VITVI
MHLSEKRRKQVIISSVSILGVLFLVVILTLYVVKKKKKLKRNGKHEHLELPLFDLAALLSATNNFSSDNKLGEGGFGPVYKVRLSSFFWAEFNLQVNNT